MPCQIGLSYTMISLSVPSLLLPLVIVIACSGSRVAVVVAGSFHRYFLMSSMQHLVRPLTEQNHTVDYFLTLSTRKYTPWRNDHYLHSLTWDPEFGHPSKHHLPRYAHIRHVVKSRVAHAGGRVRCFALRPRTNISDDLRLQKLRSRALELHPEEDPDTRFPVSSLGKGNVAAANRNMLRMFRALEMLWKEVPAVEQRDGKPYDYVLFLRDDILWLDNFVLSDILASAPADVYALSCNARNPPMLESEMNDFGLLVVRAHAAVYGQYYTQFYNTSKPPCTVSKRPCTSEELLKVTLTNWHLTVHLVDQQLFPFQRAARILHTGDRGQTLTSTCFHKYCNSQKGSLPDHGMRKCKTIIPDAGIHPEWSTLQRGVQRHQSPICYSNSSTFLRSGESGFCSTPPQYLQTVIKHLARFQKNCSNFVSYSAFMRKGWSNKTNPTKHHSVDLGCYFRFELNRNDTAKQMHITTLRTNYYVVELPGARLPFAAMRRKVKTFKILGHLIFPWAQVLNWVDFKLRTVARPQEVQKEVISDTGICVAYVAAPKHRYYFGKKRGPTLTAHVQTILEAVAKDPGKTDNSSALLAQLHAYKQEVYNIDVLSAEMMIDSAYFIRVQTTTRCRKFNAQLNCAWYQEITDHSDRDQVSFPIVLLRMGLGANNVSGDIFIQDRAGCSWAKLLHPEKYHWYMGWHRLAELEH